MSSVGFTGTRRGMTEAQKATLAEVLKTFAPKYFHHGDCIGADDEAATMAREAGAMIVCHPPLDEKLRAFNKPVWGMMAPRSHFARNRNIVDEAGSIIATPFESEHQDRGGTWYTVDYARKKGKTVLVIWPDGSTLLMNEEAES